MCSCKHIAHSTMTQEDLAYDDAKMRDVMSELFLNKQHVVATVPYITTITCCFYLCHAPVSIEDIAKTVAYPDNTLVKSLIDEVFGGQTKFYPKPQQGMFYNCKIFILHDTDDTSNTDTTQANKTRKVAIKCFTNGTLHITGVQSMHRAYEIAQMFCVLMDIVEGGDGLEDRYTIKGHTIQLINIHVNIKQPPGQSINLCLLNNILQDNAICSTYNSDRHSGVNIKYCTSSMSNISVLVFESGNVLLCGLKCIDDVMDAFTFLTNIFEKHCSKIYIDTKNILPMRTRSKKQKGNQHFDYGQYIVLR